VRLRPARMRPRSMVAAGLAPALARVDGVDCYRLAPPGKPCRRSAPGPTVFRA